MMPVGSVLSLTKPKSTAYSSKMPKPWKHWLLSGNLKVNVVPKTVSTGLKTTSLVPGNIPPPTKTLNGSHLWTHWLLLIVLPHKLGVARYLHQAKHVLFTASQLSRNKLSLRGFFLGETTTSHVMIWNHPAQTTIHTWAFQISLWLPCYFAAGRVNERELFCQFFGVLNPT